jgi:Undecaprenyl-phosphate glucose phosphotransferase
MVAANPDSLVSDIRWEKPISLIIVAGLLRVVDLAIVICAGNLIRPAFYATPGTEALYQAATIAVMLATAIIFHAQGLYDLLDFRRLTKQLGKLTTSWTMVFFLTATAMFALKISESYSRLWIAAWFTVALLVMAALRVLLARRTSVWAAQGRLARHVAIVGFHCRITEKLIERLSTDDSVYIVGLFDDRIKREGREVPSVVMTSKTAVRLLGDTSALIQYARLHRVDHVILSIPWSATHRIKSLAQRLSLLPLQVALAPDEIGLSLPVNMTSLGDVPLLGLATGPLSEWQHFVKSIFDRIVASLLLVGLAPIFIAIALAVKLSGSGPIFFKQHRIGFNDKAIEVVKFRTMYANMTDQDGDRLTERNDPRVTRVGRVLRRFSLDELPQLFNVVRGEMSLVGPRPHPVSAKAAGRYYREVVSNYAFRHRVKPGITGWAQVRGWRGETATEEQLFNRVEHDLFYINNWSFGFDLRILALTVFALIRDTNGNAF